MSFRDLPAVSLKIDGHMTPLRVYEASRFLPRARGLLGRERLRQHEALWILPCGSVHTIGMRYAIDVIFLDRQQRVVGVKRQVEPLRFALHPRAHSTIELLAGTASAMAVVEGSKLEKVSS
jgi:uncharacterized membrane protein (UPF0127 family)